MNNGIRRANRSLQERIDLIMPSVEYRRMCDHEDRAAVFRLRCEGYKRNTDLPSDWRGDMPDDYDELPNSQSFGIFIAGRLAASMRLSLITPDVQSAPAMQFFPDEISARAQAGKTIIDPSRFVTDISASAQFPELPYIAMRLPVMACLHFDADECLSMVRQEHVAFYKRIFSADPIAGPVYHHTLNMNVLLMISQVDDIHDDLDTRFPFWRSHYLERRQLFGKPESMMSARTNSEQEAA